MRVLLAIDESKYSEQAERAVLAQLRRAGTEVRVLNVIEPISSYVSADLFPHLVSHTAQIEQDRHKQAKELVQRSARRLRKAGFKASEAVEDGDPKTKIIDHAAKWPADLVVLGSHGLKGYRPPGDGERLGGGVQPRRLLGGNCSLAAQRNNLTGKSARRARCRV